MLSRATSCGCSGESRRPVAPAISFSSSRQAAAAEARGVVAHLGERRG